MIKTFEKVVDISTRGLISLKKKVSAFLKETSKPIHQSARDIDRKKLQGKKPGQTETVLVVLESFNYSPSELCSLDEGEKNHQQRCLLNPVC